MKTLTAAVLAVLLLMLSACGSGEDDKASKSIASLLMKDQKKASGTSQIFKLKQKDADCIGDGLVDKVGTKKLQKYGLLTKSNKPNGNVDSVKMSAGDAKSTTTVFFGCADVAKMLRAAINKSTAQLPAKAKTCINKTLTDKVLKTAVASVFQGKQDQFQKQLTTPLQKCATA